jgi:uncharacterized protein (UPF0305 family)
MTKKELNKMKREFKQDNEMLKIKEIYSIYIKKDNNSIIYSKLDCFESMDNEAQELYLNNFKKIIGGTLDTKLFQLGFNSIGDLNESQVLFQEILNSSEKEEFIQYGDSIVEKIQKNYSYDTDVVITLIRGEYWTGYGSNKALSDITEDDLSIQTFNFIMGSINKVEPVKKTLMFNFQSKELQPTKSLDTYININFPLDGFMFPCLENGFADINKLMYYSAKPKDLNYKFIEEVLGCTMKLTAEEEKIHFTEIIKNAVGDSVKPEIINSIYSGISEIKEMTDENEEASLSLVEIKNILKAVEAKDIEVFEKVYEENLGRNYSFNINNILPDFNSKSLKLWNEDIAININPKSLNGLKQVKNEDGRKCLVIELTDDVIVDGFILKEE